MTDPAPPLRLREPSERVSPRARWLWATSAGIEGAILVAALAVIGPVTDWVPIPAWMVVLVGVLAAAYAVVMPVWRYRVHRWEVTDTAVYTQTGWWVRERRIAPMSRIQTVDHAEGALARLFGLATVTVTTASAAGALEIVGLERDRALALVEQLAVQADTVPGDAT
ncbi:PH domain-containing protein [Nocardioides endophyticus]|uniref:PH domain-containing protein n=1 Tax=Nocardioides endophyticus TaxID=1353775 RepID=A0ABP8YQ64_9ACTN